MSELPFICRLDDSDIIRRSVMAEFPVNEYFREHVVFGANIKRTARTWIAALLISDPRNDFEFV